MGNEFKQIKILLKPWQSFSFVGRYRRDLEKPNWHYYEQEDGNIHHFRKSEMIAVLEGKINEEE